MVCHTDSSTSSIRLHSGVCLIASLKMVDNFPTVPAKLSGRRSVMTGKTLTERALHCDAQDLPPRLPSGRAFDDRH